MIFIRILLLIGSVVAANPSSLKENDLMSQIEACGDAEDGLFYSGFCRHPHDIQAMMKLT